MSSTLTHFSQAELSSLQGRVLPRHVAIIMDGNRRWAKKNFLQAMRGHWAGAQVLTSIVESAAEIGIKVLTVFAFSTENWERSPEEIETLLNIFETYLEENCQKMCEQGIRFHVIGDLKPFSEKIKRTIGATCQATQHGRRIDFVVALNYGGRDEICRVIKKIAQEVALGNIDHDHIREETITHFLDTAAFGDLDLLIRTSGEMRISNFLLWQLAYAEVYITKTLWPEFTSRDLLDAVLDFQKRQRRIGK